MVLFINSLIGTSFAYVILFDILGPSVRVSIAGVIGLGFIALSIFAVFKRDSPLEKLMFVSVLAMICAWLLGQAFDPDAPLRSLASVTKGFRTTIPLFAGIAIISFRHTLSARLIFILTATTVLFAAFIALSQPMVSLGGKIRLQPFTGGSGFHASGYVATLCAMLLLEMLRTNAVPKLAGWFFLTIALALMIGFQVRTTWVLYIIFLATVLIQWIGPQIRGRQLLFIAMTQFVIAFIAFTFVFLVSLDNFSNLDTLSSGRLENYIERLNLLSSRDILAVLFGTGPGSDWLVTDIWWWAGKDSHNDFIHVLLEGGIVALIALVVFIASIAKFHGAASFPYLFALVSSSAISNALLERPAIIPLFFLALALRLSYEEAMRTAQQKPIEPATGTPLITALTPYATR